MKKNTYTHQNLKRVVLCLVIAGTFFGVAGGVRFNSFFGTAIKPCTLPMLILRMVIGLLLVVGGKEIVKMGLRRIAKRQGLLYRLIDQKLNLKNKLRL